MKRIPRMAAVMRPFPYSIDVEKNAAEALELMLAHRFRHLPVTENFVAVSMVTELSIRQASLEEGKPASQISVKRASLPQPYLVDLNAPLDAVAEEMANRQLPSVVVTRGEKVAGIFTLVDACRLLVDSLRGKPSPDDVA